MRRTSLLSAALLLPLCFALPAAGQNPGASNSGAADELSAQFAQSMKARDYPAAIATGQKLVDLSPTAEHIRMLGTAQSNANDSRTAVATFDRALAVAQQEKPAQGEPDTAWKDLVAKIYLNKGNALLKLRRNGEASDAYAQSAALASNPAIPYFNICATYYNTGDMQNALPFCRKAAAAAPARADAWYLLGTVLFVDAKVDAHGNSAITPECRQALAKYLELEPQGPHAADVKAMQQMAPQ